MKEPEQKKMEEIVRAAYLAWCATPPSRRTGSLPESIAADVWAEFGGLVLNGYAG